LNEDRLIEMLQKQSGPALLLVLDGVTDPHNLGACLRTAEAAGVDAVVTPHDRAAGLTPVVHKVSPGAASRIAFVQVANLARAMRAWRDLGVWIAGASADAQTSIYDLDLTRATALVLGAEGRGLRRLTAEHCDHLVYLPMAGGESLNVSVAAGICLYEAVRQRGHRN
ncbi:MAG: 23S rRNA (guanosine(2251)-2'-O)-methyltransferase RlmB, partial [Gammaproteobacteria bacterium]